LAHQKAVNPVNVWSGNKVNGARMLTDPLPASVSDDPTLLQGDDPIGQVHDLGVVRHHQC